MRFKGLDFKKSRNHLARMSKDGDKYFDGTPVPKHHQVVVLARHCAFKGTCLGRTLLNPNDAPHIKDMTGHSLTNMFYGVWKRRISNRGTWVYNLDTKQSEVAYEYYQCTVYMMKNGEVYKASIKRAISDKQYEVMSKQ